MAVIILSKSLSGCLVVRLKKFITPMTSLLPSTGKENALHSPSFLAVSALGKPASCAISTTQTGLPLCQTRPGSPIPGANVVLLVIASNSGNSIAGECQDLVRHNTPFCLSASHSSPTSHARHSQTTLMIFRDASSIAEDSTNICVTACCA